MRSRVADTGGVRLAEDLESGRLSAKKRVDYEKNPPLKGKPVTKRRQNHVRRVTRLVRHQLFETATFVGWNRETERKLPETI